VIYSAELLIGYQKVSVLYTVKNCDRSHGTFNAVKFTVFKSEKVSEKLIV